MDYVTLNNGLKMPQLGFGVWRVPNEQAAEVVSKAIEVGYRLIDTAAIYGNEEGVGEAIKQSAVPRGELFITTKVWNSDHGYDNTLRAFEVSLKRLGLDYVDLYLIHWPTPKYDQYVETYKALERIYREGRAKAIGVCNFHIEHLERLMKETEVVPVVNQVECHPYLTQVELKKYCKQHNIHVEAWSPLEQGGEVLKDETIVKIADAHGKTPAQVILRWHLQEGSIVIPKSVTPSRIEENFRVFDFSLTDEEMEAIHRLNKNRRRGSDPNNMNHR
jgi:diketogulonate reductase-like aldo/keto reductase